MKQNVKKLLGCALALFLALPVLAQTTQTLSQDKLEDKILTFLQEGEYEQVKTTLQNIPVCPKSGKVYLDEVPAICTLDKFNPDPFKMKDSGDKYIKIVVNSRKDPGFTKEVTPIVVRPVAALKNSLAREYKERFGKDISEYDETGYLQFPEPYKDSWLENVVPSLLAQQIWKKVYIGKDAWGEKLIYEYPSGIAFYYDAKWHEAQGLNREESAKLEYAFITDYTFRRAKLYNPFNENWYGGFSRFLDNLPTYYKGISEAANNSDDKNFVIRYSQYVYHGLFTIDKFSDESQLPFDGHAKNNFSERDYVSLVLAYAHEYFWESFDSNMPENMLKEMQTNIVKHFPRVCAEELDYIKLVLEEEGINWWKKTPNKACENFITNAKKYGLWTDEAQAKYDNLRSKKRMEEMNNNIEKNIEDSPLLKGIINSIREESQHITY